MLILLLVLSGCAHERRVERCNEMGFKEGTVEHSQCQLELRKAAIMAPRPVIAPIPVKVN
jgi:hypothetical protein